MFQKAVKTQSKLRMALMGPSGSGKTFTALAIAKGMGGKIALIDSERASASKYADRFEFDTCILGNKKISDYVTAINQAKNYDVLVIDSLSHAWQELLQAVEKIAKAKYRGNTWSAWSEGTPEQKKLVESILSFPGHVIATMRCKTEWITEKDERTGKSKPVKIGLAPEQGKGIEYEFDIVCEINLEHFMTCSKDRTGLLQDKVIEKPGAELGKQLVDWMNDGEANPNPEPVYNYIDDFKKRLASNDDEGIRQMSSVMNPEQKKELWSKLTEEQQRLALSKIQGAA